MPPVWSYWAIKSSRSGASSGLRFRSLSLCAAASVAWSGIACDPYPQDNNYLPAGGAPSAGAAAGGAPSTGGAATGGAATGGVATGGAATGGAASGGSAAGSAGGDCPRRELFINGDFDAGVGDWFESSDVWPNLIMTPAMAGSSVMPQSGTQFARLGGHAAAAQDGLMLTTEIPATARDIVLSYYSIVTTSDTSAEPHDTLLVVLDSDAKYAEEILDNTKAHSEWRRFEVTLDQAAAGKYQVLLVRAESNDDTLATTFFVDSFSLSAAVCP